MRARAEGYALEKTIRAKADFDAAQKRMGFIPNSVLIMARKPKMVKGFQALSASVWDPEGKVPMAFRWVPVLSALKNVMPMMPSNRRIWIAARKISACS